MPGEPGDAGFLHPGQRNPKVVSLQNRSAWENLGASGAATPDVSKSCPLLHSLPRALAVFKHRKQRNYNQSDKWVEMIHKFAEAHTRRMLSLQ